MKGSQTLLRPQVTREDWETPDEIYGPLNAEFHFTLDVCATQANAKCSMYYTAEDDALGRTWGRETCWMNPPYGRHLLRWMRKAKWASEQGAIVVCLVPARTDTQWWVPA